MLRIKTKSTTRNQTGVLALLGALLLLSLGAITWRLASNQSTDFGSQAATPGQRVDICQEESVPLGSPIPTGAILANTPPSSQEYLAACIRFNEEFDVAVLPDRFFTCVYYSQNLNRCASQALTASSDAQAQRECSGSGLTYGLFEAADYENTDLFRQLVSESLERCNASTNLVCPEGEFATAAACQDQYAVVCERYQYQPPGQSGLTIGTACFRQPANTVVITQPDSPQELAAIGQCVDSYEQCQSGASSQPSGGQCDFGQVVCVENYVFPSAQGASQQNSLQQYTCSASQYTDPLCVDRPANFIINRGGGNLVRCQPTGEVNASRNTIDCSAVDEPVEPSNQVACFTFNPNANECQFTSVTNCSTSFSAPLDDADELSNQKDACEQRAASFTTSQEVTNINQSEDWNILIGIRNFFGIPTGGLEDQPQQVTFQSGSFNQSYSCVSSETCGVSTIVAADFTTAQAACAEGEIALPSSNELTALVTSCQENAPTNVQDLATNGTQNQDAFGECASPNSVGRNFQNFQYYCEPSQDGWRELYCPAPGEPMVVLGECDPAVWVDPRVENVGTPTGPAVEPEAAAVPINLTPEIQLSCVFPENEYLPAQQAATNASIEERSYGEIRVEAGSERRGECIPGLGQQQVFQCDHRGEKSVTFARDRCNDGSGAQAGCFISQQLCEDHYRNQNICERVVGANQCWLPNGSNIAVENNAFNFIDTLDNLRRWAAAVLTNPQPQPANPDLEQAPPVVNVSDLNFGARCRSDEDCYGDLVCNPAHSVCDYQNNGPELAEGIYGGCSPTSFNSAPACEAVFGAENCELRDYLRERFECWQPNLAKVRSELEAAAYSANGIQGFCRGTTRVLVSPNGFVETDCDDLNQVCSAVAYNRVDCIPPPLYQAGECAPSPRQCQPGLSATVNDVQDCIDQFGNGAVRCIE